jgi:hypothetical protein
MRGRNTSYLRGMFPIFLELRADAVIDTMGPGLAENISIQSTLARVRFHNTRGWALFIDTQPYLQYEPSLCAFNLYP